MGWIWTIVVGFLAGAIAKAIMPGKDPGGFVVTTGLGIGGAVVGGLLARLLGVSGGTGLIGSVIGALILLAIYRQVKKA